LRVFFAVNVVLWCVLFVAWVPYVGLVGASDPVSRQVASILAVTAVLLAVQGAIRWRRSRAAKVTA
jgi:hypothetical protein